MLDHEMGDGAVSIARQRRWRGGGFSARLVLLFMSMLLVTLSGCKLGKPGPSPRTVTLVVENRGFYDVNVYAVRSPGARGARLGTVIGNNTQIFRVRETDLQAGSIMVLQVRAIGGRNSWTSPGLLVGTGSVAKLDVVASGSTDLSQSQFYVRQ